MELQNYNQDIISTSGSEIPPNYSDQNNPSFPQKQYSDGQSQVQQQYNPPENVVYSQNQYAMPILPENQNPPSNYVQPITPVFQPPLGGELNISQVKHKRVTQPQKNLFILYTSHFSKFLFCFLILFASVFIGTSIYLFIQMIEITIIGIILDIIPGLAGILFMIRPISWLFIPMSTRRRSPRVCRSSSEPC